MSRYAQLVLLPCLTAALVFAGGCAPTLWAPAEPAQEESSAISALEQLETRIAATVSPPEKGARMAGLVERLQQLVAIFERQTREYNAGLARLLSDYSSEPRDFAELRRTLEGQRFAPREEIVDTLFALKAMSGRQTWQQLSAATPPVGLFVVEDPRNLRGTYQSLANLVRELPGSPRREAALAILVRSEREAGPLDARLAQAMRQDERLFASYDMRPDSMRVAVSRFKEARDAVHEHLLDTVMALREELTGADWGRMF